MAKYKLSIISACYNVENEVQNHLISIKKSVRGHNDVQVVVVDDFSTDGTGSIISSFKCDNYKYLHLNRNGGLANARKIGYQLSDAEYVWFVDGDDTIEENAVEIILKELEHSDTDVYVFDYSRHEKGKVSIVSGMNNGVHVVNSVICKVFKSKIIQDNMFSNYDVGEDLFFSLMFNEKSSSLKYVDNVIYNYLIRSSSLTQKPSTKWVERELLLSDLLNNGIEISKIRPHANNMAIRMLKLIPRAENGLRAELKQAITRMVLKFNLPFWGSTYYNKWYHSLLFVFLFPGVVNVFEFFKRRLSNTY